MNKENLIIIAGMPRAGTSYMYQALAKHPQIFVPVVKETNFFIYNHIKGTSWFENLYLNAKEEQKIFDISPYYFLDDVFFENINNFNTNQKIILLLRDPNDWIKSFYNQMKKHTYKIENFNNFIKKYEINFESYNKQIKFETFDYINKVEKFKESFKDRLLLIDFDYFQSNKLDVLQEIETFIGVNSYFNHNNVSNEKVNAGKVKNSKFISYLSTIGILRDIAFKILPNKLIHYIRNKYILGVPLENIKKDEYLDIYPKKNIFKEKYFTQRPVVKC